jgi:hypothetical protein
MKYATEIDVPLTVSRVQAHAEDDVVEVWGYVGDYEVVVCLTVQQAIDKKLIAGKRRAARTPKEERP